MLSILLLCLCLPPDPDPLEPMKRDHGPGTSGGGLSTQSAEVLKPGSWSLGLRIDYTNFQRLSETQIQDKTVSMAGADHVHFDAVRWSMLETFELSVGATESLQFGFSFGYYRATDVREGHLHGDGSYGFHDFGDISGMTDQWITSKYRVMRGEYGSLAFFGGVKLPFGDDNETGESSTSNEPLDPALQPGSGAFDFQLGAAYTRYLSSAVSMDTSIAYTYRTRADDFKIGDLILFGLALNYRFTESVQVFPQPSAFLELNVRHLFRNREGSEVEENSGGTALFVSPGFRVGFSDKVSLTIAIQIPVVQALHEEQQLTKFKVSTGLTLSF
ncbi:MAG TPA: transporter [Planctomycetota bacterium]|nr:transporter [Planctomycetota bacterium]